MSSDAILAWLTNLLILAPPLLLSLTIHEYAHARTALAFGDPTAKLMGRCSLNPLVHLDLVGTLCLFFSNFIGWAKPVPVNPANFSPRRLGDIAVSLAGPGSNLLLAILSALTLRFVLPAFWANEAFQNSAVGMAVLRMLLIMLMANIGLFAFNLVPLFPLDGHHIVREILPTPLQGPYMDWQRKFGMFGLLALILVPRLLQVKGPVGYLYGIVGKGLIYLLFGANDDVAGALLQSLF